MLKITQSSGLLLPALSEVSATDKTKIKLVLRYLTRSFRDFNTKQKIITKYYIKSLATKRYMIPRYFPVDKFIKDYKIIDNRCEGQNIQIEAKITPRNKSQEKAIEYLTTHDNGLIKLVPGSGKTVISIYNIAYRKKKTFILVHRNSLTSQWCDRFLQFTNIDESEINILVSKGYQDILLNSSIIISTVQTFLSILKQNSIDFAKCLKQANIGIFIGDEVHTTCGAPKFSSCSLLIPAKYVYGLSATPDRGDGTEDIIETHLGPLYHDDDTTGTYAADITVIGFDYQIATQKRYAYLYWDHVFQRSRYLNLIRTSEPFLSVLKQTIKYALDNNRNSIFVFERLNLIDDVITKHFKGVGNVNMFVGKTKDNKILQTQHILATPGKIRDGVDAPWKDFLVMSSPISNIEQLCGRVVRLYPDKQKPKIIDMVDFGCKNIRKTFNKRKKYYQSRDWKIVYKLVDFVNNKLIDVSESDFKKNI